MINGVTNFPFTKSKIVLFRRALLQSDLLSNMSTQSKKPARIECISRNLKSK